MESDMSTMYKTIFYTDINLNFSSVIFLEVNVGYIGKMSATEYQRLLRRRKDSPTGGHIVCPGSMLPPRPWIALDFKHMHTVELQRRKEVHGTCDQCGIHFRFDQNIWREFEIPGSLCCSDVPIPGYSLSLREAQILLPFLNKAKIEAQEEWMKIWKDTQDKGRYVQTSQNWDRIQKIQGDSVDRGLAQGGEDQ